MTILPRLTALYRAVGLEPLTGYNPHHFGGYMDAPFTRFRSGPAIIGTAGMALQEVMFVEHFRDFMAPRRILVIGNAHGWSTIALALIFPQARILAIDPEASGNEVTRQVALAGGLDGVVVAEGSSPQDLEGLWARHQDGPADLILIDAIHKSEALLADFAGCLPLAHDGTIWLFHDVINWRMVDAVQTIRAQAGLEVTVCTRTPSGMAVAWKQAPQALRDYVAVFTDDMDLLRGYRRLVMMSEVDRVAGELEKL